MRTVRSASLLSSISYQRGRRRDGHADQDQCRDQSPDHFQARVLVEMSGLATL